MASIDVVLFYSKKSVHCRNLIQLLTELGIQINTVSLDNRQNRNIVSRNPDFQITKVPTIMVVKDDGIVEMYVGEDAVKWVYSMGNVGETPKVKSQPPRKALPKKAAILEQPEEQLEEIEEEIEEEFEEMEPGDAPSVKYKPQTSSTATMADIREVAKKMAQARDQQMAEFDTGPK